MEGFSCLHYIFYDLSPWKLTPGEADNQFCISV